MSPRDWVIGKLREGGFDAGPTGRNGLVVVRDMRGNAEVYCPDANDTELFTAADLDDARDAMPDLAFVVLVKRRAAADTYPHADDCGITIGGLGDLKSALSDCIDLGIYRSKEQQYTQSRLGRHARVRGWRRVGERAYEIGRTGALRSLTIVTIEHYEVTSDQVLSLLDFHRHSDIDAIVVTNPNCRGFSPASLRAAKHADVTLMTFADFLASLSLPWT